MGVFSYSSDDRVAFRNIILDDSDQDEMEDEDDENNENIG